MTCSRGVATGWLCPGRLSTKLMPPGVRSSPTERRPAWTLMGGSTALWMALSVVMPICCSMRQSGRASMAGERP